MNLQEPTMAMAITGDPSALYAVVPGSRLAVMELRGPIFADWNGAWMAQAARTIAQDPNVAGVVAIIDSPGGNVRGASDLLAAMKTLAGSKTLHAVTSGYMASLAYMLGCVASEIAVTPMAAVGSIGVKGGTYYDTSERMGKEGVKVHVVASDPGKIPPGTPGVPITEDMLQPERDMVSAINDEFVNLVASYRRMTPEAVRGLHAGMYAAKDAVRVGLVDRIVDSTDEYIRELAARYPLSTTTSTGPRVPVNIAARAAGASLMSESTSTASAPAETAAASATPAQTIVASAPAAPAPATLAELAASIDDKAFCFDAATRGLTLSQAQAEYIKVLKAAKPASAPAVTAAAPVETGVRPTSAPEKPIALSKANAYLEACRAGKDPVALGREMFAGMDLSDVPGVKRQETFKSPEQQYASR